MQIRALLCLIVLFPQMANALEDKAAKANVAKELAVCAGYFFIGSEVAKKVGDEALANEIKTTADVALDASIKVSDKETAQKTLQMAIADHQRLMNNNTANLFVLERKYKALCMELIASPKKRYEYWQSQK